ncbi:leucine-rich repeat-containing protein 59 [Orussus abietinus]|uniref:leucine-rich repeat-containing protein 59 n=1 Tax=Orussus abietinus TaxID=222816 RepID=UPI000625A1A8|nr:leucine-rich repeat-containing protein 59 [Orussus abietinus]XP_012285196.1 leucine-rich repeat-containing protein 59 [Orussus abietinus]
MTIKMNLKDKLEDNVLDLSLCDLEEVPVKEIAEIKKASHLDLSNNLLTSLPNNFILLTHVVKLDLSKNMLTELPENFGELRHLKHLDLYSNQISRLPLSFGEMKKLTWLDLKGNPLSPAVATVAGPCSNASECQACARSIVACMSKVKQEIDTEKQRRLQVTPADTDKDAAPPKKEKKKKKKKNADKEEKQRIEKEKSVAQKNDIESKEVNASTTKSAHETTERTAELNPEKASVMGKVFRFIYGLLSSVIIFGIVLAFAIAILPLYDRKKSDEIVSYLEQQTSLPVKYYQEIGTRHLKVQMDNLIIWSDKVQTFIRDTHSRYVVKAFSKSEKDL